MRKFFIFFYQAYIPYLLFLIPMTAIFGFGGLLNIAIGITSNDGGAVSTGMQSLLVCLIPYVIIVISYYCSRLANTTLGLGILLYIFQSLIVFVPLFCLGASIAGVSMASNEGKGNRVGTIAGFIDGLIWFFAVFQLFVIPWTIYAARKSSRSGE